MQVKKGLIVLIFTCLLTACAAPNTTPIVTETGDATAMFATSIAQVSATYQLTRTVEIAAEHTQQAMQTMTAFPTPFPTMARTRATLGTPLPAKDCDMASAGTPLDITIPDDTNLKPGEAFTKTWRLSNTGTCTWTRLYSVVFFSGNSLGAFQQQYFSSPVEPGQMVDISIEMTAPDKAGSYQSNWMLQNDQGNLFGLGPNGDAPFWTRVVVIKVATETLVPSATFTATPVILVGGTVTLNNDDQIDLDDITINPADNTKADLQFTANSGVVLVPLGGAQFAQISGSIPNFNICVNAAVSPGAISFATFAPDTYLCYRTSEGNVGRIQMASYDDAAFILSVEIITWQMP